MGVNVPGCFCQYATAPAEFVWPIADTISDTDAATIEPLAVSLHALLLSGARMGDTVAVLGCGVTGLLLIHAAVAQGVRVLAHDKIAGKLDMAHMLGAKVAGSDDVPRLWLNENVTAVFECAGVSETVELALSAVPRGGRAILLGLSSSPACFLPIRLVREGIRIETSMIYDHPSDFARAIDLVAGGTLCPSRVVTNSFPFTAIEEALEVARTGQAGKVHIKIL